MSDLIALPLKDCTLCVNCNTVSNAKNCACPVCSEVGGLMNLQRILDEKPFEMHCCHVCGKPTKFYENPDLCLNCELVKMGRAI